MSNSYLPLNLELPGDSDPSDYMDNTFLQGDRSELAINSCLGGFPLSTCPGVHELGLREQAEFVLNRIV